MQIDLTGVKKDVGEVGKNVEEQKAKYDEVLKIGLSKEQLEADPKKMMEKKERKTGRYKCRWRRQWRETREGII